MSLYQLEESAILDRTVTVQITNGVLEKKSPLEVLGGTLYSIKVHVDNLTCSYMALNCSLNSSKLTCLDHKAMIIINDDFLKVMMLMMNLMETEDDDVAVDDLAVNNGKGVHPNSPTSVFELDRVV